MTNDEEREVLELADECEFALIRSDRGIEGGNFVESIVCNPKKLVKFAQSIRDQEAAKRVQFEAQIAMLREVLAYGQPVIGWNGNVSTILGSIEKILSETKPTADAFVARIKAEVKEEDAAILKEYVPDFVWEQLPADSAAKQAIGRLLNDASDLRKGKERSE